VQSRQLIGVGSGRPLIYMDGDDMRFLRRKLIAQARDR